MHLLERPIITGVSYRLAMITDICTGLKKSFKTSITAIIVFIAAGVGVVDSFAQKSLDVFRGGSSNNTWTYYEGTSNELYHHFSREDYEYLDKREREIKQNNKEQIIMIWME